jgi:hypothetical protein
MNQDQLTDIINRGGLEKEVMRLEESIKDMEKAMDRIAMELGVDTIGLVAWNIIYEIEKLKVENEQLRVAAVAEQEPAEPVDDLEEGVPPPART